MNVDRSELCPFHCRCQEAAEEMERLKAILQAVINAYDKPMRWPEEMAQVIPNVRAALSPHEPTGAA